MNQSSRNWDYGDENVYLLEHMELTDCYPVMELVKNGIQVQKEPRKTNGRIGSIYRMWKDRMISGRRSRCSTI